MKHDYLKKIEDNEFSFKELFELIDYLKFNILNEVNDFSIVLLALYEKFDELFTDALIEEPKKTKQIIDSAIKRLIPIRQDAQEFLDYNHSDDETFDDETIEEFEEYQKTISANKEIVKFSLFTLNGVLEKLLTYSNYKSIDSIFESNNLSNEDLKENTESSIFPEIDLTTQKESLRLLYDLGVLDFLKTKYPQTFRSNHQLSNLLEKILQIKKDSLQGSTNDLLNENTGSKNYPKESKKTKSIMDSLNSSESR